jgi:hypothetical protein
VTRSGPSQVWSHWSREQLDSVDKAAKELKQAERRSVHPFDGVALTNSRRSSTAMTSLK